MTTGETKPGGTMETSKQEEAGHEMSIGAWSDRAVGYCVFDGGPAGHTDFKVVVWYSRDRPLDTFKYQVYDVRKGEYTPAVDAWIQLMRTKYTSYDVALREVDLADEQGKTEMLKVGSVIKRELIAAAALEGIVVGIRAAWIQAADDRYENHRPRTGEDQPTRASRHNF